MSGDQNNEVLLQVEGVSKKFCRDLKTSLAYGIKDIANECLGRQGDTAHLRSKEFWALDNVSFELRRGECLGLIGCNGAGKTTLLRLINGLIKPDRGVIRRKGRVGALIALGAGFNPVLTGRENIYVNAAVLGLSKKQTDAKLEEIIDFADIGDAIDAPVQSYSSGMTVRLGFAIAAHLEPDILLIDEVLAVGDAAFRMKCFKKLIDLNSMGVAHIIVTHNMHDMQRLSKQAILLGNGKVIFQGTLNSAIAHHAKDSLKRSEESTNGLYISKVTIQPDSAPELPISDNEQLLIIVNLDSAIEIKNARAILTLNHSLLGDITHTSSAINGKFFFIKKGINIINIKLSLLPIIQGTITYKLSLRSENIGEVYLYQTLPIITHFQSKDWNPNGFGENGCIKINAEWAIYPNRIN